MDDERLKNFGTVLTKDYFEEQLQRIREIRLSERRFYQKITDIYATSIDYDPKAQTTRLFFAKVQNQLHWAIHGETAAEVIYHRADSEKEHMGLQTWKDAPNGKIQRFDVTVAKNYLTEQELSAMARIVNAYLDLAEIDVYKRQCPCHRAGGILLCHWDHLHLHLQPADGNGDPGDLAGHAGRSLQPHGAAAHQIF